MLKQHATLYQRLLIAMDGLIVSGCFFAAYHLRLKVEGYYPLEGCLWMLPTLVVLWTVLMYFSEMYTSFRLKQALQIVWTILKVGFSSFLIFGSITFLFNMPDVSRAFVLLVFVLIMTALMFQRVALVIVFRYFRKKGFNFRNVLIVGTGPRAQKFISEVDHHRELGLKIVGLVDDEHVNAPAELMGHKVIGNLKDIPEIIRNNALDYVVFIVPRTWLGKIEEAILYCETVGVTASIAVDLFELEFTTGKESRLFNFPLLTFERTTEKIGQLFFKRVIDIFFSGVALVLLSPFFIVIACLISMTSRGPVFFRQKRCGLNGREFVLYKFRTMVVDAEEKLEALRHLNEMEGPVFKIEKDPRITPLGRILRKLSLDELPQLWNVFRGEMSLVGPRPPITQEVQKYDHWQRRRLSMRPGITCIWQTSGRNGITDFNKWMKMDLDYIDHWSLWLDLMLLMKTIPVVLFTRGAK
ncbi:MAG: sugar transferase [Candidatus Omnitrophica bacterium]|nr:sugar transferase [Candidatus Omnitrophota bacterium]